MKSEVKEKRGKKEGKKVRRMEGKKKGRKVGE